jgi:hypothetical protein
MPQGEPVLELEEVVSMCGLRPRVAVHCSWLVILMTPGCNTSDPIDPPPLDPALGSKLGAWLDVHGSEPRDYVVDLFQDHDVVFLGEQHRVRHDVLLVQSVLEPLYEAGVRVLATEFGRREDQPLIDSLMAGSEWDDSLAREIALRQFVGWGYREYVDVYRAAWKLNRGLGPGEPPFRVLGMNNSPNWSLIETREDARDPKVRREVWRDCGEDRWARVILDAVAEGEKVVAYCGIHHGITEYRQPIVVEGEFVRFETRCGNYVFEEIGKRAITVYLHAPWRGGEGYGDEMVHPADGIIDALMLAEGPRPVGFDIRGGPFGELQIEDAVYRFGYQDLRLGDFCDGWIYTKPISEYEGVTPIENWIDEGNLEYARSHSPNPDLRHASAERFNSGLRRSVDVSGRWGHLR